MQQIPDSIFDSPFGPDKLYLAVRAYTIFLQGFFASWDRYAWDADPRLTKIFVTQSAPFVPETESKFPIIILSESGAQWTSATPDNIQYAKDILDDYAPKMHSGIAASVMSIYCIANTDTEARMIGWNVFNAIASMKHVIMRLGPGPDFIDHRPSLSSVFDAAGMIQGARPGQWYGVQVQSAFRITQNICVTGNPFLMGAIDKIRIIAQSDTQGTRTMDI